MELSLRVVHPVRFLTTSLYVNIVLSCIIGFTALALINLAGYSRAM
jgi:hypothetical protein